MGSDSLSYMWLWSRNALYVSGCKSASTLTGALDAKMGQPSKVTTEQMLVIKKKVETHVEGTDSLSKHDFIKLVNAAAKLNAELEGRAINFVELGASTAILRATALR